MKQIFIESGFMINSVLETDGDGGGFWLDTHMDAVQWVARGREELGDKPVFSN